MIIMKNKNDVISKELLEYDCLVSFGGKVRGG